MNNNVMLVGVAVVAFVLFKDKLGMGGAASQTINVASGEN